MTHYDTIWQFPTFRERQAALLRQQPSAAANVTSIRNENYIAPSRQART